MLCTHNIIAFPAFPGCYSPIFQTSTEYLCKKIIILMAVVASAPGKVLMTGGYLVLERPNAGIVLSTNARFYAVLKPLHDEVGEVEWMDVKVNSPQMSRETTYKMSLKDFTLNCSRQLIFIDFCLNLSESRNPFVEYAVQYSVAAAYTTLDKSKRSKLQKLLSRGMDITILGCNDFYSYRNQEAVSTTPLHEVIGEVLKAKWDHERTKFSLPPLMNLILGEPGSGGSSTPSMVGAVKKWQKSDPEKSKEIWDRLSEANSALEAHFNLLSKMAAENWDSYKSVIDSCCMCKSEKWKGQFSEASHVEIVKALLGAREAMLKIRCHMRQMGEAAGIPIEPESQTRLLDVTMDTEGVLLAGVPGAGGFDAVFAITLSDSSTNLTKTWSSHNVLALLVREDPCGVSLESGDPRAK
ncbi:hypothetical protein M8C21_029417 [Ambrosia artemisiifolia]|uniref:Phosphomevalonate kinase n=1 Tax=Ambrosia artemisiifolia TaxID=4212 RepID=A0AAD5CQW2_AMBAR|nr:hypothetical protein M8C21_029417 [Ambrosia artemisiifolia]